MKSRKKLTRESRLYANIWAEIKRYGGHTELLDAILTTDSDKSGMGKCALLAWYMRQIRRPDETLRDLCIRVSDEAGVAVLQPTDARYAWFGVDCLPLSELEPYPYYRRMREELSKIDIDDLFWVGFLPYGFKTCYMLTLYVMRLQGYTYDQIADCMYCAKSTIAVAVAKYKNYNIKLKTL